MSLQMVEFASLLGSKIVCTQTDHELAEGAGELERHLVGIILDDRRAGIGADVERFIEREPRLNRALDAALRHLLAVNQQRAHAALADTATIVDELKPYGVLARGQRFRRGDTVLMLRLVG